MEGGAGAGDWSGRGLGSSRRGEDVTPAPRPRGAQSVRLDGHTACGPQSPRGTRPEGPTPSSTPSDGRAVARAGLAPAEAPTQASRGSRLRESSELLGYFAKELARDLTCPDALHYEGRHCTYVKEQASGRGKMFTFKETKSCADPSRPTYRRRWALRACHRWPSSTDSPAAAATWRATRGSAALGAATRNDSAGQRSPL